MPSSRVFVSLPARLFVLVVLSLCAQAAFAQQAQVDVSQEIAVPVTSTLPDKSSAPRRFDFNSNSVSLTNDSRKFSDSPGAARSAPQQSGATFTPLTPDEKMKRAFKSAFLTPRAFAFPFLSAAITEIGEDKLPHKDTDDRVADGFSRFARNFGTRATRNLLASGVFPILFRQDPRYFRSDKKGFGARTAHAVSRVFVTNSDEGKLQPNYSRFAGVLSASAISNLWEHSTPGHDRIGTDATFRRFGKSFINDAAFNVLNEFWPDIKKIFKH